MVARNESEDLKRKLYDSASVSLNGHSYVWAGSRHVLDFRDAGYVLNRVEEVAGQLRLRLTKSGESAYTEIDRRRFPHKYKPSER